MSRVVTYIDGFNLYFGLRSKGWRKYYWLDLVRLSCALLKAEQQLEAVHYFTSRIILSGSNAKDVDRQNIYLEALSTLPFPRNGSSSRNRLAETPLHFAVQPAATSRSGKPNSAERSFRSASGTPMGVS
jgi:hypothetical protein